MKTNRGLGRGLSALFSDTEEAYENASKQPFAPETPLPEDIKGLTEVDIDLVRPTPTSRASISMRTPCASCPIPSKSTA